MASHLMDDVERVCENIVLLHKGKLAAQGKIEDLKAMIKKSKYMFGDLQEKWKKRSRIEV